MPRYRWVSGTVGGLLLSAVILGLPSCNRTTSNTTINDEFDKFGDRTLSMHGEARLLTRDGEAAFENAKAEIADGKYRSSITKLERLVADRTIDPEIREQAVLSVAEAHGSWLNPFRDYQKGVQYGELFLKDYPDSSKREHVQQLLEQYRKSLADQTGTGQP